jgi:PKD repeat protein
MKRIHMILLITGMILVVACESTPTASFYIENADPEVGQQVFFTNSSDNARSFEWDFGDGSFSEEIHPSHVYTSSGTFQIKLTAFSKSGLSDEASSSITVLIPTLLEVEVLEFYDQYPVENASVLLFPTLDDWDLQSNVITEGFTDASGKVLFSGLGSYVFYLDIWETNHNNYTLRAEDVNFIRTPQVIPHQINRFTAFVDYMPPAKGTASRDRKIVLKKLVPRKY